MMLSDFWITLWLCQNSHGTWPCIVSFPIKHGDFPDSRYVSLPEDTVSISGERDKKSDVVHHSREPNLLS